MRGHGPLTRQKNRNTKKYLTNPTKNSQTEFHSTIHKQDHLGYAEDSLQFLQEGEKLSRDLGDERSLANFYSSIGTYYSLTGDSQKGIKYTENSFRKARKVGDAELVARTAFDLCTSYHMAGEHYKQNEVAHKGIGILEKTQRQSELFGYPYNPYSGLCGYCGLSYALLGNFHEGESLCERGLRLAVEINHLSTLAFVENCFSYVFAWKGDGRNTIKHSENAIEYCEKGQVIIFLGMSWAALGLGYFLLGESEIGLKYVKKGLDIHLSTGNPYYVSLIYVISSLIHFDLGDFKNAQTCAQKALELSHQINEKGIEGGAWNWLGRGKGKAGSSQFDEAKECILKGIKIFEELKMIPFSSQGYVFLGELYADTGQKDLALENLKKAEAMLQEMGMDYWLGKTQEVLRRLQQG